MRASFKDDILTLIGETPAEDDFIREAATKRLFLIAGSMSSATSKAVYLKLAAAYDYYDFQMAVTKLHRGSSQLVKIFKSWSGA